MFNYYLIYRGRGCGSGSGSGGEESSLRSGRENKSGCEESSSREKGREAIRL